MATYEIQNLDAIEVSLTRSPAVKEEFLIMKNELSAEELESLAQSLGVSVEEIPEVEIQKHMTAKAAAEAKDKAVQLAARMLGPYMDQMPTSVQKFFSSVSQADQKKPDKASQDEEYGEYGQVKKSIELLKSTFPDLVQELTKPLQEQLSQAQSRLASLEEEREASKMRELAKSMPGDLETTTKRLVMLKKSLPEEEFQAFVKDQVALGETIRKSEAFKQISSSGEGPVDVTSKVEALAREVVAKSTSNPTDPVALAKAIEFVLDQNPDLKRQYYVETKNR